MRITEFDDIQALVRTGFTGLRGCAYVLLRVKDAGAARAWLAKTVPTSIADLAGDRIDSAVQIALTAPGLAALGVDPALIAQFAPEFVSGSAEPSRARRLGDTGSSAPGHWAWGAGEREPHVLVMLFCEAEAFPKRLAALKRAVAPGFNIVATLDSGSMGGREPFGFVDGLSQPAIDWAGTAPRSDTVYGNYIAAGEVLLGYPDERGQVADRPLLAESVPGAQLLAAAPGTTGRRDLARNGSYLVFRRLAQDVRGFWRWVEANGGLPVAEAMVGRRLDGAPLDRLGQCAIDGVDDPRNDFTYDRDRAGHACPHGGHIRRANPRTADLPGAPKGVVQRLLTRLGLRGAAGDHALAGARRHRILRRGREYGTWLAPEDAAKPGAPDPRSGLNFVCLQASIARQFEFVQGSWLNSPKFGGLADEPDPVCGSRDGGTAFSRQRAAGIAERHENLPRFVEVTGSAYFFLPSLRALRFITRA